ncbi:MAG: 16S rRNA (guanine(527)-N(7))-methyltransferase RsmG [Phenylobacterium sp.]|nr:16S rRNA (guanine(527)-N(7))-methyltransferase RsmG [Phenylobacterium sp.]
MPDAAQPEAGPALTAEAFAALTGADARALADLEAYRQLLEDWTQRMNLVGPSTLPAFWSRHALDSAQLLPLAPEALTWADLGTGAGLPGVVLAILGRNRPGFHVHLVESMAKRCRFLEAVVAQLGLPASVHAARGENLDLTVDIVTSRACAPLVRLLGYARPYFLRGATGLFLKGQDVVAEIKEATRSWEFEVEILPSLSDDRGRVLRIRSSGRGPHR